MQLSRSGLGFVLVLVSSLVSAQNPEQQGQITFHASTSLVLVDVIAQDSKGELAPKALKQEDFEVRDNGNPTAIASFDDSTSYGTHPLALWFVVICNEGNNPDGSEKFIGKETAFRPALDSLAQYDRVGVAQWCDNGEARVDLSPSADRDAAIRSLAQALKPVQWVAPPPVYRRLGEMAFQWMMELLIDQAHATQPEALPVIVCLYGDHSGQPIPELEQMVDYLLSTNGFVYGIKDRSTADYFAHLPGNRPQIVHYMAEQTGGQYFAESPDHYAAALGEIIAQMHSRYGIGIHPVTDGKRHKLTVELTKSAHQRYKSVKLRYRAGYTTNVPLNVLANPLSVAVHDEAGIPRRMTLQAKLSADTTSAPVQDSQRYVVNYSIPEPELKYVTDAQGNHVYSVQFAAFVYDKQGNQLDDIRNKMKFHVASEHFAQVQQDGVSVRETITVSKRATVVRFMVRDQLGGDIGAVDVSLPPSVTR